MPNGVINYDYRAIGAAEADVQTFVRRIQAEIDHVDTIVKNLGPNWNGQSWDAYHAAQRDMNLKLQDVAALIARIQPALAEASGSMRAKDASLASSFAS